MNVAFNLSDVVACPSCGASLICSPQGEFSCSACSHKYPTVNNVLHLRLAHEASHITAETEAAKATEGAPELGGINDEFEDLANASGELREAILALPFGNDSKFFREPGYFQNVSKHSASYRFIFDHLPIRKGDRVLDLGADLTWSTKELAKRGATPIAVDINHHLEVGNLYQEETGARYFMVNADMHSNVFLSEAFNHICAFSVLHHSSTLRELVSNLYRMLKPGGSLGFVEPYCLTSVHKESFGKDQIEEGINENIYTLSEWQEAFESGGFQFEKVMVSNGFNAILRKPLNGTPERRDIFRGFYRSSLSLRQGNFGRVAKGEVTEIPVEVTNRGEGIFCSEGLLPVMVSYHLSRKEGVVTKKKVLVSFDNPRTPLTRFLYPRESCEVILLVEAPHEVGKYEVEIDLVQEGVAWFNQKWNETVSACFQVSR